MARILVLGSLADSLVNFRGAMLEEMVSRGHEVYACAPNATLRIKRKLREMGVIYRDVLIERGGTNPVRDTRTIINLFMLFRNVQPDIFIGYTIKPVIYGSLAAKLAGVPKIFSMITGLGTTFLESADRQRIATWIAMFLYKLSLPLSRRVFFQNPDDLNTFLRKKFVKHESHTVIINGSGIDVEAFKPADFPDQITFLLIARLLRDKGIVEYIEAAKIVKQKHPHIRFRLVGWIDSENPSSVTEQELDSWTSNGTIEYLGKLDDVRPSIAESSVYVLPSYREGTPRSVLEAMAMGRPIITTDVPGCRETVINGQNGILVQARDSIDLASAMNYFIEHPEDIIRMGSRSRHIAVDKYDVHKVNAVILENMDIFEPVTERLRQA
ncbi:MAG: glycosyltransferase family 4 protein [Pseudomonadota bacterium]